MPNHHAYTKSFGGQISTIKTSIGLKSHVGETSNDFTRCTAIWDTGATITCITPQIASSLALKPISVTTVRGVNDSELLCPLYVIDLRLPNGLIITTNAVETQVAGTDILIGMDVISRGDFALTHNKIGEMIFSFVIPPSGKSIRF